MTRDAAAAVPVTKLQFAPLSAWEDALILDKDCGTDGLRAWLGSFTYSHIGAEAFFEIEGTQFFVGLRMPFSGVSKDGCLCIAEGFLSGGPFSADSFIKLAEDISGAPIFCGEPDFMELGLVNMWQSYGALRFWEKGDGEPLACLRAALSKDRRFSGTLPAPPAAETAWNSPLPVWTGVYLAGGSNGKYFLDMSQAEKLFAGDLLKLY